MKRHLPPFSAVRAFEAAARHMSFKDAADELCLTPSAISHQVRALEDFLATKLFVRDGTRLHLTLTGQTYQGKLTGLLDALDDSTRAARRQTRDDLRVLATPGFAARWLVPRLERFAQANTVRLRVSDGAPSTDFATNEADVVIHWADDPIPGARVEPLMQSGRFPVVSPAYRAAHGIARPEDLLRATLFHDEVMDGWADWFRAAGVTPPQGLLGPQFAHCELSTTAAERGQGVALAYETIIEGTLAAGTLEKLFAAVTMPVTIYSVAYADHRANEPGIRAFRDFLFREAQAQGCLPPDRATAAE